MLADTQQSRDMNWPSLLLPTSWQQAPPRVENRTSRIRVHVFARLLPTTSHPALAELAVCFFVCVFFFFFSGCFAAAAAATTIFAGLAVDCGRVHVTMTEWFLRLAPARN